MSDKTVLITGASGLLGREILTSFQRNQWTAIGTGLSRAQPPLRRLDLSSEEDIHSLVKDVKPLVVIHSAALKYPDKCDRDPDMARRINVASTTALATATAAQDAFLIYISTDYVFPGARGDAPYETSAPTNPSNVYGRTKLQGEQAVLQAYKDAGKEGGAVVLRVPVLYGRAEDRGESSVNSQIDTVTKAAQGEGKVKIDHYAQRFPTCTEDVARVCEDTAKLYRANPSPATLPRILHFSGRERYTKYDFCLLFADILGLSTSNLEPNTQPDPPDAQVKRPYDSQLSVRELEKLGIDVSNADFKGWWRRELRAFRK